LWELRELAMSHRWERATLPSPKRSRFGFAQAGPVALLVMLQHGMRRNWS
jgi:hypothetical protein